MPMIHDFRVLSHVLHKYFGLEGRDLHEQLKHFGPNPKSELLRDLKLIAEAERERNGVFRVHSRKAREDTDDALTRVWQALRKQDTNASLTEDKYVPEKTRSTSLFWVLLLAAIVIGFALTQP
jgi:hypothetical protein